MGAIPKTGTPQNVKSLVLLEPEALMQGRDASEQMSYGRFALQDELSIDGIKWCVDERTGVTAVLNLDVDKAKDLCREHGLRSVLTIKVGDTGDCFHSIYWKCHKGVLKKVREYRVLDVEPTELFERVSAQLLIRIPDLSSLGVKNLYKKD